MEVYFGNWSGKINQLTYKGNCETAKLQYVQWSVTVSLFCGHAGWSVISQWISASADCAVSTVQ
jgi:hypothetical protein